MGAPDCRVCAAPRRSACATPLRAVAPCRRGSGRHRLQLQCWAPQLGVPRRVWTAPDSAAVCVRPDVARHAGPGAVLGATLDVVLDAIPDASLAAPPGGVLGVAAR